MGEGKRVQEPSVTEAVNPRTRDIDRRRTEEILTLLLDEDARVPAAVREALPALTRAAERLSETLARGGRWLNLGAGTSGRLGLLDAAELPPTYGIDPDRVQAILAGGPAALATATEGAEDDAESARAELRARGLCERDALLAISASGRTPFVLAAVEHARSVGATTLGLTCAPGSELVRRVEVPIVVVVGPEAIAGSTRLKGGLAQKMVLQMLSTTVMIRCGRVRGNLMTELRTQSGKLHERAVRIVMELTGAEAAIAEHALEEARGSVSGAVQRLISRRG
ncbi:MAG: N-acetylmuramic acid 6-phosphate etherase [Myxococcota bacterium]